jgi:DNA invertase Pin-like site-specific DNA recombinase
MARKSRKGRAAEFAESNLLNPAAYNAGAYLRLSRDDAKKGGDSLETQRSIIENFVAANPDITLLDIYMDNDRTGTDFERPGFRKMLADAEAGRISCIIVKDLTRFGRNAIDAGYYIEKLLPSIGVRFVAVTDAFDSNEGDGGILLPLKNIISESYALDISRKCKAVQRQNIRDGRFVGRMAPYGYAKDPEDCHHLIVDTEAADTVRKIFGWAAGGASSPEIAGRLNAAGILSPSHYKKAKGIIANEKLAGNSKWKPSNVATVLRDRMYMGDMVQGKTKTVGRVRAAVPADEWIVNENTHEPIVSRQLFEAADTAWRGEAKKQTDTRREAVPYTESIFKGKVFCAHCGYAMHRHRLNRDNIYRYICRSRELFSKDSCVPVVIREADMKAGVLALLRKHGEVILGRHIELEKAASIDGKNAGSIDCEIEGISRELGNNGHYLKSLYENLVTGLIAPDEFATMKAGYEMKIGKLSRKADTLREKRYAQKRDQEAYRSFAGAISQTLENEDLTADAVGCLIEKIYVGRERSIDVHFKFKDELMEGSGNG